MKRDTYNLIRSLGFKNYAAYLRSPHWKKFRARYQTSMAPWRCFICGTNKRLVLHHHEYSRLGHERLSDVVPLCPTHHRGVHGHMKHHRVPVAEAHIKYKAWIAAGRPPKKRRARRKRPRFT